MANIITVCRILLSIALLFFPAFSPQFYILYLSAGFSDMIDGMVARKTNTASESGARLDTIADFVFAIVCLIKLLPVIDIPTWLWIFIAVIAVIKIINIASGFIIQKRFVAEHTVINKITGFLLFILPLTFHFIDLKYSAAVLCALALFAAIQEGHYIRTGKHKI
ncbi:MAG: CDP-alcohol phosphatidyltransferase family protein [Eubacteriales bacterium]